MRISFKKANYKCYICGDEVVKGKDCSPNNINFGTLDHVIPRAKGGYSNKNKKLLLCIIPTKEYFLVKEVVLEIDKNAFFLITDSYEAVGGA